jgi:hypothetical protein
MLLNRVIATLIVYMLLALHASLSLVIFINTKIMPQRINILQNDELDSKSELIRTI